YGNGVIAARADRNGARIEHDVFLFDDLGAGEHHYAFTWKRDGDNLEHSLYIDGELQGTQIGAWRDPGETVFIGGGTGPPNGNDLGSALFDEVRIYDTALTAAEIMYLSMNAPETVFLT